MPIATPLLPGLVRSPLVGPAPGLAGIGVPVLAPRPQFLRTPIFAGRMAVSVQNVYPPRLVVTASGILSSSSQTVTIYRLVAGVRTAVRNGSWTTDGINDAFVVTDAEEPFGLPVRYVAVYADQFGNLTEVTSDPTTVTLSSGKPVLTDAVTGAAAEVTIANWTDKTQSRQSTVFNVNGSLRGVVGPLASPTSTLELFTETDSVRTNLKSVVAGATSGILQLRSPYGYSVDDAYLLILSLDEQRFEQNGTNQRRLWSLEVAEVSAWAAGFTSKSYTYADLAAKYLTYADVAIVYSTYLALAQADLST